MFRYYNPNPAGNETDDCVVRAICKATGESWDKVFLELCVAAFTLKEMPSTNPLWHRYLREALGLKRVHIPDTCPDCYTIRDFATEHPAGAYILATGTHVVTVIDGDWYDTWDSGNKVPIYYWRLSDE